MAGTDGEKLKKLQAQSKAAADMLFRRKRDLQRVANEVEEESERLTTTTEQIRMTQDHVSHLQSSKAKVEDEEARVRNDIRIGEQRLSEAAAQHRCVCFCVGLCVCVCVCVCRSLD